MALTQDYRSQMAQVVEALAQTESEIIHEITFMSLLPCPYHTFTRPRTVPAKLPDPTSSLPTPIQTVVHNTSSPDRDLVPDASQTLLIHRSNAPKHIFQNKSHVPMLSGKSLNQLHVARWILQSKAKLQSESLVPNVSLYHQTFYLYSRLRGEPAAVLSRWMQIKDGNGLMTPEFFFRALGSRMARHFTHKAAEGKLRRWEGRGKEMCRFCDVDKYCGKGKVVITKAEYRTLQLWEAGVRASAFGTGTAPSAGSASVGPIGMGTMTEALAETEDEVETGDKENWEMETERGRNLSADADADADDAVEVGTETVNTGAESSAKADSSFSASSPKTGPRSSLRPSFSSPTLATLRSQSRSSSRSPSPKSPSSLGLSSAESGGTNSFPKGSSSNRNTDSSAISASKANLLSFDDDDDDDFLSLDGETKRISLTPSIVASASSSTSSSTTPICSAPSPLSSHPISTPLPCVDQENNLVAELEKLEILTERLRAIRSLRNQMQALSKARNGEHSGFVSPPPAQSKTAVKPRARAKFNPLLDLELARRRGGEFGSGTGADGFTERGQSSDGGSGEIRVGSGPGTSLGQAQRSSVMPAQSRRQVQDHQPSRSRSERSFDGGENKENNKRSGGGTGDDDQDLGNGRKGKAKQGPNWTPWNWTWNSRLPGRGRGRGQAPARGGYAPARSESESGSGSSSESRPRASPIAGREMSPHASPLPSSPLPLPSPSSPAPSSTSGSARGLARVGQSSGASCSATATASASASASSSVPGSGPGTRKRDGRRRWVTFN